MTTTTSTVSAATATNKNNNDHTMTTDICRIAIVGANKTRLSKVLSLLPSVKSIKSTKSTSIQYLPCVAQFGTYQNEHQERVVYLQQVDYHPALWHHHRHTTTNTAAATDNDTSGADTPPPLPTSLLELANSSQSSSQSSQSQSSSQSFPTLAGIVVGAGLDGATAGPALQTYFQTLFGSVPNDDNNDQQTNQPQSQQPSSNNNNIIPLSYLQPTAPYTSLQEERQAYQELSPDEKQRVTHLGPAKMARWIHDFAQQQLLAQQHPKDDASVKDNDDEAVHETAPTNDDHHRAPSTTMTNTSIRRYACRKCRHILFTADDLTDSHRPAQHSFVGRHHHSSTASSTTCQSLFLSQAPAWLSSDSATNSSGKMACPACQTKVGAWSWSGAQCSCGTWIVPAFQIPTSRVDVVTTNHAMGQLLPPGTVVSPWAIVWQQQQQQIIHKAPPFDRPPYGNEMK